MGKKRKKHPSKKRKAHVRPASGIRPAGGTVQTAPDSTSLLEQRLTLAPPIEPSEEVVAGRHAIPPPSLPRSDEEADEHRASARVAISVDIHLSSDSHFFAGLSGDISEGGLFLSTYRELPIGSEIDLEFSLPGSDRPVRARGEVRWLREHAEDQPRGVGVAFEDLSDEDRERIHEFCSSRPPLYYDDVG